MTDTLMTAVQEHGECIPARISLPKHRVGHGIALCGSGLFIIGLAGIDIAPLELEIGWCICALVAFGIGLVVYMLEIRG